jgi:hypothetical protein
MHCRAERAKDKTKEGIKDLKNGIKNLFGHAREPVQPPPANATGTGNCLACESASALQQGQD